MKKIAWLAAVLCGMMLLGVIARADGTENVYVRVESALQDAEATLLTRTAVPFAEGLTALDALKQATDDGVTVVEGEYGAFVTGILDVSDDTGQYAWMMAVNDEMPPVSADNRELAAGDEVVFYFTDWQAGAYAYFDAAQVTVETGEAFTLTLNARDDEGAAIPVAGAQLIITGDAPLPRIQHNTDENGQVTLTFAHPGDYTLTARKGEGATVISRPYALVSVTGEAETDANDADEDADEDATDDEAATPADEAAATAEPADDTTADDGLLNIDLEALTPLMLVAPVSYDPANGDLFISGQFIPLPAHLKPVFDEVYDELFIPLRALAEATGMEVAWDAATRSVTLSVMGKSHTFAVTDTFSGMPVKIIDNRVYVPTMFLIEVVMADAYF